MRASLRFTILMAGLSALALTGCGGASKKAKTAADLSSEASLLGALPAGGLVYGRMDLERLRSSEHVQRVVGWVREVVGAVPGVEEEASLHIAKVEELFARTEEVALAVYLAKELGEDHPGAPEDGAALLLRASIDVEWIEAWAAEAGVSFDKRIDSGRVILTPANVPSAELAIIELGPGLFGVVVGPEAGVLPRLRVLRERVESGARGLDDPALAKLEAASGAAHAPFGVVARIPAAFAEDLARGAERAIEKKEGESSYDPADVSELRGLAVTADPSVGLTSEAIFQMETPEAATRLAVSITSETEAHAKNRWVLLLGWDLWLERSETISEDHLVRSTTRLSVEEMRMWLFHVERLVLFGMSFLDGGVEDLFGGLAAIAGPGNRDTPTIREMAPPYEPEEMIEPPPEEELEEAPAP